MKPGNRSEAIANDTVPSPPSNHSSEDESGVYCETSLIERSIFLPTSRPSPAVQEHEGTESLAEAAIAFIGGSGLYDIEGLAGRKEISVDTPFGPPSDVIVIGSLDGTRVAFLPRHGRGHRISPTELPVRANIYALKEIGVEKIVSISAVGSLKEGIRPLDMLVPDQIIDRTRSRVNTFFGDGIVAHVGFADPFCSELSKLLIESAQKQPVNTHEGGTYLVIEGPQFSTRAESELYRSWGASVIGMTAQPEAKLAREAEMCYATLALVTDYDVWHQTEEEVSVELVIANLTKNVENSRSIITDLAPRIPATLGCDCSNALEDAIITNRNLISSETRERLSAIIDKYV